MINVECLMKCGGDTIIVRRLLRALCVSVVMTLFAGSLLQADEPLTFQIKPEVVHRELNRGFCWFHPRVAALPGYGKNGAPAVIMTIQKHLAADDHYSGMWYLRTDDLGKTWTKPIEIAELAWGTEPENVTISVADVTPGWHAQTGKMIAIGIKVRYSAAGAQLLDKPRSHECAYATFDPKENRWSKWKMLAMPDSDTKFYLTAPGCVQWVVEKDGSLLIPLYYRGPSGDDYSTTIVRASFDGETMKYIEHGDEMEQTGGRGLCEPSLVKFQDAFFLTIRNDARGYVTRSADGLHFEPRKEWTFDDGKELGSYNTQQHWLAHGKGLFLCYTRRGANNDHIARNRAPLFIAQVDPVKLHVIRSTEQVLLPERGVMLGNFGAAPIDENESWVTDAEFLVSDRPHERGADGSTWISRVRWSQPNE